jgi:glutathione reductase (NADPH)
MTDYNYDLLVIGAGSGGVRAARMAAAYGVRVAIIEAKYLGGTCVNAGCVPKKLFVYAAQFQEAFEAAAGFGWTLGDVTFDWTRLLTNKNREIERLHGIYKQLLQKAGVSIIYGSARFRDAHTIITEGSEYTAERILVATGGGPYIPDIPGKEYVVTSNDMFFLPKLPERMLIVGGGYIAVEFASIMHGLGVDITLCYRDAKLLNGFDEDVRDFLAQEMMKKGIKLLSNTDITAIENTDEGLEAHLLDGAALSANLVMYATGRTPHTKDLGLESCGVELDAEGAIKINRRYQTTTPSIYAIGDVTNRVNLTPVALAEGMALVDNLFAGKQTLLDYDNIPTAVFSQPNIGTVGLTEAKARQKYPDIDIYKTCFKPLKSTLSGSDEKIFMKMIVVRSSDRVVGMHMAGAEAGEIMQGMATALRAGVTKAIVDSTLGIHPTIAEEFVTMREKSLATSTSEI